MENVNYVVGIVYIMYDPLSQFYYIGSTSKTLQQRRSKHITSAKQKNDIIVYNIFNKIGWDNIKIEALTEISYNKKQELLQLEQQYISSCINDEKCLNSMNSWCALDKKEYIKLYYKTNKDKICEMKKKYYLENRHNIIEKVKNYYSANKEIILNYHKKYLEIYKGKIHEYKKVYREKNKEKIREDMKKYKEENIDHLKEYLKQYYINNRDKHIQYQKEYYVENKENIITKRSNYYNKNKNIISERCKIKILCCCGSEVRKCDIKKHERTKKHLHFTSSNST